MRVLQVYRDYFTRLPGGIERHVRDLATGLDGDIAVEVLASAGPSKSVSMNDEGARVHLVRELGRPAGVPIWVGARKIVRGNFDLLHLHAPNPTGEFVVTLARPKVPIVVTYHADVFKARWGKAVYLPLLRRVLDSCDRIIVSSRAFAQRSHLIAPILERDPDRVAVIPFGVDLQRFTPGATARSRSFRTAWGGGPIVLFVGRLRHYKGLTDLVAAVAGVEATLVVAGDGPERERLIREAGARLGPRFVWLGRVDDDALPDIYRAADLFCLASSTAAETFGIATVEALACGLPAVTTEIGTGTSTVNEHGITGLVVPPADPGALRDALEQLLGDDAHRRVMGDGARQRARTMFDRDAMLHGVRTLYERLI